MPEGRVAACSVNVPLQSLSAKSYRTIAVTAEGDFPTWKVFPIAKNAEKENGFLPAQLSHPCTPAGLTATSWDWEVPMP